MRFALIGIVLLTGCTPSEPDPPEVSPEAPPVDPRVAALYARLNDNPDLLHFDYTPAVHELIAIGRPAIAPALDLMLSENATTRLHAVTVLEGVTMREHGWVPGQEWARPGGLEAWHQFWQRLGNLSDTGTKEERSASIAKWRDWLAEQP
jgi:hypothetical protein